MKYLGIDFGEKRIGIAFSDDEGTMAFPREVMAASPKLAEEIGKLAAKEGVCEVVLGESRNFAGKENPIQKKIETFRLALRERGLTVHYEPEFMTSAAAEHIQGKTVGHDSSAAALILQSYLDKKKNSAY